MDLKRRDLTGDLQADTYGRKLNLPFRDSVLAASEPFAEAFNNKNHAKMPTQETVPMDLHHPILREFPEHREIIRRLKGSDDHFRKMFDEYHRLDDAVYRIEEEIDFATDQEIDELKLRRAKLKDYIYHLVRHAPPSCPACEGTGIARPTL